MVVENDNNHEQDIYLMLKKSIWYRLIAVGLIYLVIIGNVWFVFVVTKTPYPPWLFGAFAVGVFWIFINALCLLGRFIILLKRFKYPPFG